MRDIKFRCFDVETGEFVTDYDTGEFSTVEFSNGSVSVIRKDLLDLMINGEHEQQEDFQVINEGFEVMQFTGLKDKNGVDIYEEHELNDKYGVRFEDGAHVLYNISNGDRFQSLNKVTINAYELEITREYTKLAED